MVHALTKAHRVLASYGRLLDLRPDRDPGGRRAKPLETYVTTRGGDIEAGALMETPSYYADFIAADRAVQRVIRQRLFGLQAVEIFRLRWYFRTLDTLEQALAEDWTGTSLPASVRGRLASLLNAHPNAQIAVTETFRLNVLHKR
jgi:hypothetical protein